MNQFRITTTEDQRVFLTSDTHFGHENIIRYCGRPFANADEMDAEMIRRWNLTVRPGDVVLHLGDFAYKTRRGISEVLAQLNGIKYLVQGNHDDTKKIQKAEGFEQIAFGVMENNVLPGQCMLWINDQAVAILSHYPLTADHAAHRHLLPIFFGHIHTSPIKPITSGPHDVVGTYDVGVDSNEFYPVPLDVAKRRAWRTV